MNRRRIAALLFLLPAAGLAQHSAADGPMRVLFIGNSYTYVNDLPMVVADLASAAHEARPFRPDVVLVGGATLVLYETWAREAQPGTQDSLTHVYHKAASDVHAVVAPVGEVWSAFRAQEGAIPAGTHSALFRADGSHPSPLGTYLAATVLYQTLYGKNAVGLPATTRNSFTQPAPGSAPDDPRDTVPSGLARKIQELASKVKK